MGRTRILRFRADFRTLFFVGLYFTVLATAFVVLPARPLSVGLAGHAGPLAGTFAVLCVLAFMGAVATHNALHSPLFGYRWMNKAWQVVLTLTYGHPVSSYVPGHNLSHHKHTQTRRDVMRTSKARFRWNLLNGLLFVALIGPSIAGADRAYAKVAKKANPRWGRQLRLELCCFWAVQIALFVVDWQKALVLWFLPHLYAQWGIVTMNLLQHDGCDQDSAYDHSRNFVGRFVNFWTYNNGFHTIHHMEPGLHWSLAPAEHQKRVAPHIHPNLDQKSIVAYIWRTFFLNQRLRYDGTPVVLPDEGPDEAWIPEPRATRADLGAESLDSPTGGLLLGPAAPAHAPRPRQ